MDIPAHLLEQIKSGQATLFLGAGASRGAIDDAGNEPPIGQSLASLLADKFLGGSHREDPLANVSELAISESDLTTVQEYIRSIFEAYNPASFHKLIPSFRWRAIATTNYDLVVERAYQTSPNASQTLVPFLKNGDRVDDKLSKSDSLMFLKLHGCITRTTDPTIPLILTPDQYVSYLDGRTRLFTHLEELGHEHSIVFVGTSLQDSDLRHILLKLSGLGQTRPRYYTVTPSLSQAEIRLWESKRISPIQATFQEFLEALDAAIPGVSRTGAAHRPAVDLRISQHFASPTAPVSDSLRAFLSDDAEFVHAGMAIRPVTAKQFYRGVNQGWSAIEQGLDIRRGLNDTLLSDFILLEETERRNLAELLVIKAHAGAGKSVCLKRLAWDASLDYQKTCLFLKRNGRLSYEAVDELCQLTKARVFIFVDNAGEQVQQLEAFLVRARRSHLPVTVVAAERVNEWNMSCERLEPFVAEYFDLPYLNHKEIGLLVDTLERNRCLGVLQQASAEDRFAAFQKKAGRQLLVALHEATSGRPLEDILEDEYKEIRPEAAQELYLNICLLNRFDVPVRAGVIARVQGISFSEFREKLFRPLEHVVHAVTDPITKDNLYTARHPQIAEIVCERVLRKREDAYDAYHRVLNGLNLDYGVDRTAYRRLLRGRVLLEQFPDHNMVASLFAVAAELSGKDAYYYQQLGLYEMHRPNGSLSKAHEYLRQAHDLAKHDKSIAHSLAELARVQADQAATELEKEKFRREARRLAYDLVTNSETPHGYHTLTKIALDRLEEVLENPDTADRDIDRAIEGVERHLEAGLQRFPNSSYLLDAESKLSELLHDQDRALKALERAFEANQRSTFVATRLARCYLDMGDPSRAMRVLEVAVEANAAEKRLHFALAKLLIDTGSTDTERLEHHLRRGFTQGDNNYDAQFWYARHLYLQGLFGDARDIFGHLRQAPIPFEVKDAVRGEVVTGEDRPRIFSGAIVKLEASYAFIERDGTADWIFAHTSNVEPTVWERLEVGVRVRFNLGFSFKGSQAINVVVE